MTAERVTAAAGVLVAVAALVGNWLAWRAARSARRASDTAEQHLDEDRQNLARRSRAEFDLERVRAIAEIHGYRQATNVLLSPADSGKIIAALDSLPASELPLARIMYHPEGESLGQLPGVTHEQRWEIVRGELAQRLQALVRQAAGTE